MMARFGEPYLPTHQVLLGEPLKSIGRTTFTRTPLLCWEVPMRSQIWDTYALVEEDVKDYLQNHHKLRSASGALCSLCFVGRNETQVKAVVVVHCEDTSCRSMALDIIGDSPEWRIFKRNHPGFALMSAPKAPSPRAPYINVHSLAVYCSDDADLSVGTSVRFGSHVDSLKETEPALARIGPTIFHDGQPYIISVSHQLGKLSSSGEPNNPNTSGSPYSSGSLNSEDNEDAWDLFDDDEISRITPESDSPMSESVYITPVHQGSSPQIAPQLLASSGSTLMQSIPSTQGISQERILQHIEASPDDTTTAHEWKRVIGEVVYKSSDVPSKQHDWSLIKPSQTMYSEMKRKQRVNVIFGVKESRRPIQISQAAEISCSYKTVWLATSKDLYEEAVLSGSRCSYRLPGTHRFLYVLPLHTRRHLARGESGTAVLDPEEGSWYGQIIAAHEEGNVAYVLPATGILESIAQSLGVRTASLTFSEPAQAGLEVMQDVEASGSAYNVRAQFDVQRHLGHGSFGDVTEVREITTGEVYARKIFHLRSDFSAAITIRDVQNEVKIMQRLHHDHIATLSFFIKEKYSCSIMMRPVADCDLLAYLENCMESNYPISLTKKIYPWFGCILHALAYAHQLNIKHGDIKPGNILIKGSEPYLADFGAAKDFSQSEMSVSAEYFVNGTPVYRAPEAQPDMPGGRAADVFALGCVYAQMLTVLKRKNLGDFQEFRRTTGSASKAYAFRSNLPMVKLWIDNLVTESDHICDLLVDQISAMLREDPTERPAARNCVRELRPEMALFCEIHQ